MFARIIIAIITQAFGNETTDNNSDITSMYSNNHCTLCFFSNMNNVWNTVGGLNVMLFKGPVDGLRNKCSLSTRQALLSSQLVPYLPGWYLHLVVLGELEYPSDPESYATGSVATGRVTLGGQVEGEGSD
jgi:hypothetical protein